jgi:hypothetical protein
MEKWLYLVAIIVFFFALIAYSGQAATVPTGTVGTAVSVSLNASALEKGYTVKSGDNFFWLPVFPKQFSDEGGGSLNVNLTKLDEETLVVEPLPVGLDRVSSFYSYEISGNNVEATLAKPVLLSLKYFSDEQMVDRAIYLFSDGAWQSLDTKVLEKDRLAQAWSCHAAGIVVVAEQKDVDLTARAAIVIDDATGDILFSKNVDDQQSIASLTKIVTALVFLDHNPGWQKIVEIKKADNVGGSELNVKIGDKFSAKDVFFMMLVGSKNNMAMALARSTGLSQEIFVGAMNKKAKELGAGNTTFVEPTGLDSGNVSTAEDLAKIMRQAFRSKKMLEATTMKTYSVAVKNRNKKYLVENTNKLLATDLYITGGKTGHTDEAGYCLGTKAKVNGRDVLAVVLGAAPERNYKEVYYLIKKFATQS